MAAEKAASPPARSPAGTAEAAATPPTDPVRRPIRVLLVDDEEDFVNTIADRMEMRHLESEVALSGEEALCILRSRPDVADVVVLDVLLPGMGGIEVLREVRKAYPEIQVIMVTGHGSDNDEARALRNGAFAYLHKPVDFDELLQAIRSSVGSVRDGQ